MTTVVHNGQALVKVERKGKGNHMGLREELEAKKQEMEKLEKQIEASEEIAKAAKKWKASEVPMEVITQGLTDAGYPIAVKRKGGGTRTARDWPTIMANVKSRLKDKGQSRAELAEATGTDGKVVAAALARLRAEKQAKMKGEKKNALWFKA